MFGLFVFTFCGPVLIKGSILVQCESDRTDYDENNIFLQCTIMCNVKLIQIIVEHMPEFSHPKKKHRFCGMYLANSLERCLQNKKWYVLHVSQTYHLIALI